MLITLVMYSFSTAGDTAPSPELQETAAYMWSVQKKQRHVILLFCLLSPAHSSVTWMTTNLFHYAVAIS